MPEMTFSAAIEAGLAAAMEADETVIVFGEDVELLRNDLLVRFGGKRVRNTPISESAFLGAAVGAAMMGLRPVVEIMLVDFLGVCFDALLNQAAKIETFSGGGFKVPMVVRSACGAGYGDGGQHEQSLWGMLAGVPGLSVVVPSNPADAAGLMLAAVQEDSPVVYLEHKMLADYWLDYMGIGNREGVTFDVPAAGARGEVRLPVEPVPLGKAATLRGGSDIAFVSLGLSVHRCLEAAAAMGSEGVRSTVVDLRSVRPLDTAAILEAARRCRRVVVVDEDYRAFGLSGEVAAVIAESGTDARFARVCTEGTIPYARRLEDTALPNVGRILEAARGIL
ncbi:MAG: transketolase C-terminal domain-containing protein [Actinomycetota bacterium]